MTETKLFSAGDYVVLATKSPYLNVNSFTSIVDDVINEGTGTIFQKQFRYSLDDETYAEYVDLNLNSLADIKCTENGTLYFQFRYTLLSGGPVTVKSVDLTYTTFPADPTRNFIPANIQDETRVYAYPITYKSGAKWDPYKMNRAVRLFKDLNLMVNTMFGHEVQYYRALPSGRSKDVFLLEYSLYEHDKMQCVKVVVPENKFPDNKFNMGPFGVDYDFPFEVQVDKEYFQTVFGDGTGPQKRDVIFFPRTNRIYEVSSSYLFRDFMNEPLYFKVTLIKWAGPKSNIEMSDDMASLADLTVSVEKLFGIEQKIEKTNIANPVQFEQNTYISDPVRSYIDENIIIGDTVVLNNYLNVAEYEYLLKDSVSESLTTLSLTASSSALLTVGNTYYARFLHFSSPGITASYLNDNYFYSMKKLKFLGVDSMGNSILDFQAGESQIENNYENWQIFGPSSSFHIYENEFDVSATTEIPLFSCINEQAKSYQKKMIEYKAIGEFTSSQDRAVSAWFRLKKNTRFSTEIDSLIIDEDDMTITLNYVTPHGFLIGNYISLRRASGGNFNMIGEIIAVNNNNQIVLSIDNEILGYVNTVFPLWKSFSDLKMQLTFPRVLIDSRLNKKGIRVDLLEKRYFRVYCNETAYFFILPNTNVELTEEKWYSFVVSMSNLFCQLTFNVWEMQWNESTKLPATSDLRLIYGKTISDFPKIDRSSNSQYFLISSDIDITNIRVWSQKIETEKQPLVLNQNIVKDASKALVIDNAIPRSRLPYISYTH